MKKKMLFAAGCLMALAAHADGAYSYLTFTHNNLAEQSFSAADLTITFENGQAVVAQNGNKTTLALADLQKMRFTAEPAGVEEVVAEANGPLTVVTLSGQRVGTFKDKATMERSLKKGLYVVKTAGKTYKYEAR